MTTVPSRHPIELHKRERRYLLRTIYFNGNTKEKQDSLDRENYAIQILKRIREWQQLELDYQELIGRK
jgi:hypothetical protein